MCARRRLRACARQTRKARCTQTTRLSTYEREDVVCEAARAVVAFAGRVDLAAEEDGAAALVAKVGDDATLAQPRGRVDLVPSGLARVEQGDVARLLAGKARHHHDGGPIGAREERRAATAAQR